MGKLAGRPSFKAQNRQQFAQPPRRDASPMYCLYLTGVDAGKGPGKALETGA
jgi:hypothetical protein